MPLGSRFDATLTYAHNRHRNQTRNGTHIPHVYHLLAVAAIVSENGGSEDEAIAALLHDAAEDQCGRTTLEDIRSRFGDDVATILADCTDPWSKPRTEWRTRKQAYLARLPQNPRAALLVPLTDKTHNAEAIFFDQRELGEALWPGFSGGAEGTRWYDGELSDTFRRVMPGRRAAGPYRRRLLGAGPMKRQTHAKQDAAPTDDRWRHVTQQQFEQALQEIIRDIKLRKALEEFAQWSPPRDASPH